MNDKRAVTCLPILPLRGLCVFPGMVTHFDVGRKKSVLAVEEALRENQRIFLVAQKDVQTDDPKMRDLYDIGTIAEIKQILRMPGENMRILVEGCVRAELIDVVQSEPYLFGRVSELADVPVTRTSSVSMRLFPIRTSRSC